MSYDPPMEPPGCTPEDQEEYERKNLIKMARKYASQYPKIEMVDHWLNQLCDALEVAESKLEKIAKLMEPDPVRRRDGIMQVLRVGKDDIKRILEA